MRTPTLFAGLLALTALGYAQAPSEPHERAIWDAYQSFRQNDSFKIELTGYEQYGQVRVPVHSVLYWKRSTDPRTGSDSRVRVSLVISQFNAKGEEYPTMRIVGDGVNLYRYDLLRREVSTTTYGFYGDQVPGQYPGSDAPKLLSQLRAATPGSASYLARLASEINASGDAFMARYNSWSPGMFGLSFDELPLAARRLNGPPMEDDQAIDPITGNPILRGTDRHVFYGFDRSSPARTTAFTIYDADESEDNENWQVQDVRISLKSADRIVSLLLRPQTETIADGTFGLETGYFRPVSRSR